MKINHAFGLRENKPNQTQFQRQKNAAALSKAGAIQRAVTKSSQYYKNDDWDLVDALKHNKVKIEDVKAKDLPENMLEMTVEERKAYVEIKGKQRAEIQQRIQELDAQRKEYVAKEMKKRQKQGNTLGSAIIQAISEQARGKNFKFQPPEQSPKNVN